MFKPDALKAILTTICLLLFSQQLHTRSVLASPSAHVVRQGSFYIECSDEDKANAQRVLGVLDKAYDRVADDLGLEAPPEIRLVLADSPAQFSRLTRGELPDWAEGATVSRARQTAIVLRSPKWDNASANFEGTVIHEMTHVLVAAAVHHHPIPRWLNEGLAIYYSGERQWASASRVSRALLTNSIIALEDIEQVNTYNEPKAQLAYQESHLAVRYIIETYGVEAIKSILAGLRDNKDTNEIFYEAVGLEFWEFEREWSNYLRRRYRWSFLADAESFMWIGILVLLAGAFLAVQRRKRKTLRRWEEEGLSEENHHEP